VTSEKPEFAMTARALTRSAKKPSKKGFLYVMFASVPLRRSPQLVFLALQQTAQPGLNQVFEFSIHQAAK
jgi:hypothetical protein